MWIIMNHTNVHHPSYKMSKNDLSKKKKTLLVKIFQLKTIHNLNCS